MNLLTAGKGSNPQGKLAHADRTALLPNLFAGKLLQAGPVISLVFWRFSSCPRGMGRAPGVHSHINHSDLWLQSSLSLNQWRTPEERGLWMTNGRGTRAAVSHSSQIPCVSAGHWSCLESRHMREISIVQPFERTISWHKNVSLRILFLRFPDYSTRLRDSLAHFWIRAHIKSNE